MANIEGAIILQNQSVAPLFRAKQRVRKRLGTQKTLHTSFLVTLPLHELLSTRIPKLGCAEDGRFGYDQAEQAFYFKTAGDNTKRLFIDSAGNVGIGTTAPKERLHVAGLGEYIVLSD